ncbi:MerR family transcriptional regulator [Mycobacteroides chelonae]|uniref:MerR family transcriptional regulator n=1 Tax=Mycobacteroides chelonae TaxID=1774 RepID=UPI0008A8BF0E|nr:MerR family transcriptional regulator [Mycobacteroides chelonae]OHU65176.1 peroxiredoxin [Mycobacteroides chelonae]
MKIGELAQRAEVTVKAVRYYESLGLIKPRRLANGYRSYDEDDVRLVREIKALYQLGVPVERTRPFLECLAAGRSYSDECPASLASYREVISEMTERIEALQERRSRLIANLNAAANRPHVAGHRGESSTETDLLTLPSELPVPENDGATAYLAGTRMPAVGLLTSSGNEIWLDALGMRRTVIYIYPLTGRPGVDLPEGWNAIPGARGCTPEACSFRDHFEDLLSAGAGRVYGLSSQDVAYQSELAERLHLPFDMLSDPSLLLADALELPTFHSAGMRLYKRLTLVVRNGAIEHVFYPVFPPSEHAEQVLSWLRDNPQ